MKRIFFLSISIILLSFLFGCITLKPTKEIITIELLPQVTKTTVSGWTAFWSNDFDLANTLFMKALDLDPNYNPALRGLGLVKFCCADEFSGFNYLNKAVYNDPANPLAVPVRDFMEVEIPFRKSNALALLKTNKCLSRDPSCPIWNRREGLLGAMNYHFQIAKDIKNVRRINSDLGFINDWVVLGPFPNLSHSGFDKEFIPETNIKKSDFVDREYIGKNNMPIKWIYPAMKRHDGDIPLSDYLDDPNWSAAYAYTTVDVSIPGEYLFVFSQSGAIKCWVDYQLILSDPKYRRGNETHWLMLNMGAGIHTILVKLCNEDDSKLNFSLSFKQLTSSEIEQLEAIKDSKFYNELFIEGRTIYEMPDPIFAGICQLIDKEPNKLEYYFWLAYMMQVKGFGDEGIAVLDKAFEVQKELDSLSGTESALFHFGKRWCYLSKEKKVEARKATFQAVEVAPGFPPANRHIIDELIERKNFKKADRLLDEMFEVNPDWYYGLMSKLSLNFLQEKSDEAYLLIDRLNELYPDAPGIYALLAMKAEVFNLEHEVPMYTRKMGESGEPILADFFFLERSMKSRNFSQAYQQAKALTEIYPTSAGLWIKLIHSQLRLGGKDAELAESTCKELQKTFPYSLSLLSIEALRLEQEVYGLKKFIEEQQTLLNQNPQAKEDLEDRLNEKTTALKQTLGKILTINPRLSSIRDKVRHLNEEEPLDEIVPAYEFADIIEEFEKKDTTFSTDYVILLDDIIEMHFEDGASKTFRHFITKVLSQKGVESQNTFTIRHHPYYSTFDVLHAHVIKEDGSQIEAVQYGNKLSFTGLEKGDYIDVRYTVDTYKPGDLSKEFWTSFQFDSDVPVLKDRFSLLYPKDKKIEVNTHNTTGKGIIQKRETIEYRYKLLTVTAENLPPLQIEPLLPDDKDLCCWLDVSTLKDWYKIHSWYTSLYQGQCEITPKIEEKVKDLTSDLNTKEEKIKALYNFISREIEYEDRDFQYSAFIPQKAESVLEDGFGDCKDKCTLLITMLKVIHVPSYIALSEPGYSGDNYFLPSNRFSHTVVVIPMGEQRLILDPSGKYYTYPDIPTELFGTYYLPISNLKGDIKSLLRLTEVTKAKETIFNTNVSSSEGKVNFSGNISYEGFHAAFIRMILETEDKNMRRKIYTRMLNSSLPDFELTSIEWENLNNLQKAPIIRFKGILQRQLIYHSDKIVSLKMPWVIDMSSSLKSSIGENERQNQIFVDNNYLSYPRMQILEVEIPKGYRVISLPQSETLTYRNAEVVFKYEQRGGKVICERKIYFPQTHIPQTDYQAFKQFILKVDGKENEQIMLKPI